MALDSIFSYFIARGDDGDKKRLGYLSWFVMQYPQTEFRREDAIFRNFMEYCFKLSVPLKLQYLDVYLSTELREFCVTSKTKIDGTESLSYDDPNSLATALTTIKDVMYAEWKELEATETDVNDFPVFVDKFRVERRNARAVEVYGRAYDMTSRGLPDGPDWAREQLNAIEEIYTDEALEEITDTPLEEAQMDPVVTTGIPAIDKDIVALCRTQLLDISAPPGAGKTRMAIGVFVHRALMAGKNVLYYTLEQSKVEIENMLVARHVFELYGDIISDKMIAMGQVPPELQGEVAAARVDILEEGKHGKFLCVESDLYLETFIDKIRSQDRVNGPFDVIIIDHMSLIQSKPNQPGRRLEDYQIVARAYRRFKRYVRKNRKAGISVNQFNQAGIEASRQDKEINATMAAGGVEAYRSPDANLVITYNDAMASQSIRRCSLPKTRSSEGFNSILLRVKLACCYFQQETNQQAKF